MLRVLFIWLSDIEQGMNINSESLNTLWYENKEGEEWLPPDSYCGDPPPPEGFVYQVSEFPCQLRRTHLKLVQ